MGRVYDGIDEPLADFIARQHVFFVASAPLAADGHVNLSPRGLDTFRVLDERTVAWLDLTGSGIETIAHLKENGRITVMFCAFEGPPRIVRLAGTGEVLPPDDPTAQRLPAHPGARAVIRIAVERVWDSCGYGVPRYAYEGERTRLTDLLGKSEPEGLRTYWATKNAVSIDGLAGLTGPEDGAPTLPSDARPATLAP